ncbi:MAG: hypothetical protein Q9212_007284, partial [Teloschistes hypoglaucus]
MRIPFFRIFYSTTFTILSLVLFLLVLITPMNLVYEAFRRKEIYDIFIIFAVFVLTLIIAVLLYASRLYYNRRNLVHIPSDWSPLDAEKKVRKLVEEKLEYAAGVAYRCKPRDLSSNGVGNNKDALTRPSQPALPPSFSSAQPRSREEDLVVVPPPPWGIIFHPGWSSPSSPDLPDIQFETIIRELPNLIEAKA